MIRFLKHWKLGRWSHHEHGRVMYISKFFIPKKVSSLPATMTNSKMPTFQTVLGKCIEEGKLKYFSGMYFCKRSLMKLNCTNEESRNLASNFAKTGIAGKHCNHRSCHVFESLFFLRLLETMIFVEPLKLEWNTQIIYLGKFSKL